MRIYLKINYFTSCKKKLIVVSSAKNNILEVQELSGKLKVFTIVLEIIYI